MAGCGGAEELARGQLGQSLEGHVRNLVPSQEKEGAQAWRVMRRPAFYKTPLLALWRIPWKGDRGG